MRFVNGSRSVAVVGGAVLALAPALAGCGGGASNSGGGSGPIKIGVLASLSGLRPAEGKLERASAQAAVDDINKNGGVGGRKLQLVVQDDGFAPAQAVTGAERLIQGGAVALTGLATSDMQKAVTEVADRRQVVLVGSISNATGLTDGKTYAFRTAGENNTIGKQVVAFAQAKGAKKVAIVADQGSYGQDIEKVFTEDVGAAGGMSVVTRQPYTPGATNLSAQAVNVKRSGADSILLAASVGADAGLFGRSLVENGVNLPIYGHSGLLHPDAISTGGEFFKSLPAVYGSSPLDRSRPDIKAFGDRIKAATGIQLTDEHSAQTYDAVRVIALGLAKTNGKGGLALAKAIESIDHYTGLAGRAGSYYHFSAEQHTGLSGNYLVFYKFTGNGYEQVAQ